MVFEDERTGTWHAYGNAAVGQPKSPFDYKTFRDQHKPVAGTTPFAAYLAKHFPEVAASIDESDHGEPHLEVGALRLATREAILKRDWDAVARHFAFVDSVLEGADTALHDAIGVSYLVSLFYGETSINYAKARTLLPKRLARALEIMERHYEELRR